MDLESTVMGLICNAGEARSCAMEATKNAREGQYEQARILLQQADDAIKRAHIVQTELIGADEGEGKIPVTLVLVHAQDHLMTTMQAIEQAQETVLLYQRISAIEVQLVKNTQQQSTKPQSVTI